MTHCVVAKFVVKPERWDEFQVAFLHSETGLTYTRAQPGCREITASIGDDDETKHTVTVCQLWVSKTHQEAYVKKRIDSGWFAGIVE